MLLRPLKNIIAACLLKIAVVFVDHQVEEARERLRAEEAQLKARLSRLLAMPEELIVVRFRPFRDGSVLPTVELRAGISQYQLDVVQDFLDGLSAVRQNVRRPLPALN